VADFWSLLSEQIGVSNYDLNTVNDFQPNKQKDDWRWDWLCGGTCVSSIKIVAHGGYNAIAANGNSRAPYAWLMLPSDRMFEGTVPPGGTGVPLIPYTSTCAIEIRACLLGRLDAGIAGFTSLTAAISTASGGCTVTLYEEEIGLE
jgi:hypothetical protein